MSRPPAITHYALYGEALGADDPEFVHIEDISARSSLYEWRIRPHLHQGRIQFIFLRTGRTRVWLDETQVVATAPSTIVIPAGVVHGFEFEPDTAGRVVTASEALLSGAQDRGARPFRSWAAAPGVFDSSGEPQALEGINRVLEQLAAEFAWPQRGRNAVLAWLFQSLAMMVWRQVEWQQVQELHRGGRPALFARYRQLVEERYREHWRVEDYAHLLGVTPSTLNRACRRIAGKAAMDLIQDRLLAAARRHLIYTDATVEAIAESLGFQDPAYFSRFFKRRANLAPGRFRELRRAA